MTQIGVCGAALETQRVETWALHWPFTGVDGVGLPFYGFFKACWSGEVVVSSFLSCYAALSQSFG